MERRNSATKVLHHPLLTAFNSPKDFYFIFVGKLIITEDLTLKQYGHEFFASILNIKLYVF